MTLESISIQAENLSCLFEEAAQVWRDYRKTRSSALGDRFDEILNAIQCGWQLLKEERAQSCVAGPLQQEVLESTSLSIASYLELLTLWKRYAETGVRPFFAFCKVPISASDIARDVRARLTFCGNNESFWTQLEQSRNGGCARLKDCAGVVGALVIGNEGFLLESTFPPEFDAHSIGLLALVFQTNNLKFLQKSGLGSLPQSILKFDGGYMVVDATAPGLLVILCDELETHDLLHVLTRAASHEICASYELE